MALKPVVSVTTQQRNPKQQLSDPGVVLVPYPSGTQAGVGGGATWGKYEPIRRRHASGHTLDIAIGDAATRRQLEAKKNR